MKKYLLILGAVLGIALFLFAFSSDTGTGDPNCEKKVRICHYPQGNFSNPQDIIISVNGWENGHECDHEKDYKKYSLNDCKPCKVYCK